MSGTIIKNYKCFSIEIDDEGIAFVNLKNNQQTALLWMEEFVEAVNELLLHQEIRGIVYQAGIQIEENYKSLFDLAKEDHFAIRVEILLSKFLAIYNQPKPLVAILPEKCLSSKLSWMLWAHYRIGISNDRASFHFPESKYGLFPLFGATYQVIKLAPELLSIPFLTQVNVVTQSEAFDLGLIDRLVSNLDESLEQAKNFINIGIKNIASGIDVDKLNGVKQSIQVYEKRANQLIPSVRGFLQLASDVTNLPIDQAIKSESQLLKNTLEAQETLNLVRTNYYSIQKATKSTIQIDFEVKQVGILGAGMMGSGIAYEAARAGINVILKDVSIIQAELGKSYSQKITNKLVEQKKLSPSQRDELLARINPTDRVEALHHSDLIIEAVFEEKALKASVTRESLPYLSKEGVFATNTTSLPIAELALATNRPENFIGLHFFSPVDRMALVEVIVGKQTNKSTLIKALQVVKKLGKIPIVVHDSPAFFTSRIFFNYLLEAITMLLEGIPAQVIDDTAKKSGFAVGPLAVLDEISISLMLHVYDQLPTLHANQKRAYNYLKSMIAINRNGRKAGKGFYDYAADGKKTIWNDETIQKVNIDISNEEISKRLLHIMALDSYRCLEEGVLTQITDGDIGSVLGVGFAAHTGGVFGHIDLIGIQAFVDDCIRFRKFGEQWEMPSSLGELAASNTSFYSGFTSN